MTHAELAKVRELVAVVGVFRDTDLASIDVDVARSFLDRFNRAFLAVEAMVAEHQTDEAVAEECARIAERAMDGIVGAEIAYQIRSRFGGKP